MNLDIQKFITIKWNFKKDSDVSTWLETCAVAINDTLIFQKM